MYIEKYDSNINYYKKYLIGGGLWDIIRYLFSNGILYNIQNNIDKRILLVISSTSGSQDNLIQYYSFLEEFNNLDIIIFANYKYNSKYSGEFFDNNAILYHNLKDIDLINTFKN